MYVVYEQCGGYLIYHGEAVDRNTANDIRRLVKTTTTNPVLVVFEEVTTK